MNINKYSINSLFKLTLIFSIIFGVVNSVSAQESQTSPSPVSNDTTETIQIANNEPVKGAETTNNSHGVKLKSPKVNNDQKSFLKDNLLYSLIQNINLSNKNLDWLVLATLATLFIFWCLNKKQQQKKFDEFEKNQIKIIKELDQFKKTNKELNGLDRRKSKIIKEIPENNPKITDSEIRSRESLNKQKVQQEINHQTQYRNGSSYSNSNSYVSNSDRSTSQQWNQQPDTSDLNRVTVVDNTLQFVEKYNRDKSSLSGKEIATVAATQKSLNQRRSGNSDTVTLENTTKKKYWIIEEDKNYYLIPHAQIKIDEFNIKTLESLFDCTNFTPEYLDFQLVQPAKVSQVSSESWQLEKKGKLEFS